MSAKYTCNVSFDLDGGELEPEVNSYTFDRSDVESFEDNSYWQSTTVESSGGELSFVVTADDQYDAERKVEEVVYDGMEVTDGNDYTWVVRNLSVEVEEVEVEMTLERAKEILSAVSECYDNYDGDREEAQEAVLFILGHVHDLEQRNANQAEEIRGLNERVENLAFQVRELQGQIDRLDQQIRLGATDPSTAQTFQRLNQPEQ